jgi:hypothetical protein
VQNPNGLTAPSDGNQSTGLNRIEVHLDWGSLRSRGAARRHARDEWQRGAGQSHTTYGAGGQQKQSALAHGSGINAWLAHCGYLQAGIDMVSHGALTEQISPRVC